MVIRRGVRIAETISDKETQRESDNRESTARRFVKTSSRGWMTRVKARINIHSAGRRVSRQRHQTGDTKARRPRRR